MSTRCDRMSRGRFDSWRRFQQPPQCLCDSVVLRDVPETGERGAFGFGHVVQSLADFVLALGGGGWVGVLLEQCVDDGLAEPIEFAL